MGKFSQVFFSKKNSFYLSLPKYIQLEIREYAVNSIILEDYLDGFLFFFLKLNNMALNTPDENLKQNYVDLIKYSYKILEENNLHCHKIKNYLLHKKFFPYEEPKSKLPHHWEFAFKYLHEKIIAFFINKEINPNILFKNNLTPLHLASKKNAIEIVRSLLQLGAYVNIKTQPLKRTPLYFALKNLQKATESKSCTITGNQAEDLAEMLIEHGANIHYKYRNKLTALHLAVNNGSIKITHLLVNKGININTQDFLGITPLHCAILKKNFEITRYLLSQNADLNAKTINNRTPLHCASLCGNPLIISLLLCKNADVNAKDTNNDTPLHYASLIGENDIVRYLLERGADAQAKNLQNEKPIDIALKYSYTSVINTLNFEERTSNQTINMNSSLLP